jgi:uncharacterized ion transporter superfamily protein YfcC
VLKNGATVVELGSTAVTLVVLTLGVGVLWVVLKNGAATVELGSTAVTLVALTLGVGVLWVVLKNGAPTVELGSMAVTFGVLSIVAASSSKFDSLTTTSTRVLCTFSDVMSSSFSHSHWHRLWSQSAHEQSKIKS